MFTQKPLALVIGALCGLAISAGSLAADTTAAGQAESTAATSKKTTKIKSASIEEVYVHGTYTARSMNGATGIDMSLRETPQTVTIMTSQMIEDKGLVDMEQVLDHVPGVSKVGDASEYSIMYVRGFQLDTGVQVDGMITTPANGTYAGDISQGIDPALAERVEVLKGAAGILGGQGEPSATVNMIRKRPTADFQSSVLGSYGSWDNVRAEGDVSGALNESGSVRGRFIGTYLNGDSYIDRYSREKSLVYGIVDFDAGENTILTLAVDNAEIHSNGVYNWNSNPAFYNDGTLIDHDVSYSTGQDWSYRDIKQWSVMPEIKHTFDSGWTLRSSYRYSEATQDVSNPSFGSFVKIDTGDFVDNRSTPYSLLSTRASDTQSFNIVSNGNFGLFGREHDVVVGYNYSKNEFDLAMDYADLEPYNLADTSAPAPDYSGPSSPYGALNTLEVGEQSGAYATVRFSLADPLKLMLGGRVSDWSYDNTNYTRSTHLKTSENNVTTPYAGIVYDVNSFLSLYTSYTGIFLPSQYFGADGNILEPTEGTNTEAGIKMAFFDNDLNISAAAYQANKDNVAEFAGEGQLPNGSWIYRSVDGIETDGWEVEIAGSVTENWNVSGGFTSNKAEDKEGNPRETYIPGKTFKFTNTYSFTESFAGLTLGGSVRWQNDTYYDTYIRATISATGEQIDVRQEQPAYWLVDVMARYELSESLAVTLNIDNLFDEFYSRSIWGYADYGEPRSATVAMKYTF
jgi:TonB-dependent siderophore receptor